MRIGIIIGRIGGVDGVALETEKWIEVLSKMGHEIYLLSGVYQENIQHSTHEQLLPVLSFFSPECEWEQQKAFFEPDTELGPLIDGIRKSADHIRSVIVEWARTSKLDVIISENASALPCHLSMGLGIKQAIAELGLPTITHDHDFAWERGDRYLSPHEEINQLVRETFPLVLPHVRHAVINLAAQETLKERFDRDSVLVPNVMNFDLPYGQKNEFNSSFLQDVGLNQNKDIPVLQVTRIVKRKGIETAIDLIHRLDDKRFKLLVTGSHHDDEHGHYFSFLLNHIHTLGISDQIVFASERIGSAEAHNAAGLKVYSLSDAYAWGRACTYFSTYEGFGNAFVEAVHAKKPIFVNNYKPVFWPDIGSKGFEVVMLEDNKLTDQAVEDMRAILLDPRRCEEIAKHNFELGKKHFSYPVLEGLLEQLLSDLP